LAQISQILLKTLPKKKKERERFLATLGIFIVAGTFVINEHVRDARKDTVAAIDNARTKFEIVSAIRLEALETEQADLFRVRRPSDALMKRIYENDLKQVKVELRGTREFLYDLPFLERRKGDEDLLDGFDKKLESVAKNFETNEGPTSWEVAGASEEYRKMTEAQDAVRNLWSDVRGFRIGMEAAARRRAVFTQLSYDLWSLLSGALFFLGAILPFWARYYAGVEIGGGKG